LSVINIMGVTVGVFSEKIVFLKSV